MQQLKLNEESGEATKPQMKFWRRQFHGESTVRQKKFDYIFGVILPVICFAFDPIVFKTGTFGSSLLGTFKPFAYILSFASIMTMIAWQIWGKKLKWLSAPLAGFFLVSGIISLGVGVVLFPFSLLGLIMIIGVLGFTPLFSAFVFLRNSFRAFQEAKPFLEKRVLVYSFALAAILTTVIPSVANLQIKKALDGMSSGDVRTIRANARILKFVAPVVDFEVLVRRYRELSYEEVNTEEMKAIAEAYEALTGENIDRKAHVFMD